MQDAETRAANQRAAEQLQGTATFIESGQPGRASDLETAFAAWNHVVVQVTGNDRPRLVRRIIDQVRQLG